MPACVSPASCAELFQSVLFPLPKIEMRYYKWACQNFTCKLLLKPTSFFYANHSRANREGSLFVPLRATVLQYFCLNGARAQALLT